MDIRFKVNGSDLNSALAVVRTVTPREFDRQKAGYLFVIRGNRGYVYSRDSLHVARASFDLTEPDGEGAFIYPAANIGSFSHLEGDTISFRVTLSNGSVSVQYTSDSGAGGERASFESKYMTTCDKELDESAHPFKFAAGALREAVSLARGFLPADSKDDDDPKKTLQVFDKTHEAPDPKEPSNKVRPYEKGDGFMYATNGTQAFHLECSDFVGKSLTVHAKHIPLLQQFLSHCKGDIIITTGLNSTFARDVDSDRVLGWSHATKQHARFSYYSFKIDQTVGFVDRDAMLKALAYTQSEMEEKSVRIRVVYDNDLKTLQVQIPAEGTNKGFSSWKVPISVEDTEASKDRKSFVANAHIDHFRDLFSGSKGSKILVRFHLIEPKDGGKSKTMMRSIDDFVLDRNGKVIGGSGVKELPEGAITCRVTRFTPSFD